MARRVWSRNTGADWRKSEADAILFMRQIVDGESATKSIDLKGLRGLDDIVVIIKWDYRCHVIALKRVAVLVPRFDANRKTPQRRGIRDARNLGPKEDRRLDGAYGAVKSK